MYKRQLQYSVYNSNHQRRHPTGLSCVCLTTRHEGNFVGASARAVDEMLASVALRDLAAAFHFNSEAIHAGQVKQSVHPFSLQDDDP